MSLAMMPHAESAGRTQPKGLAAAQVSNTVYIEQDASFAPLGSGYLRDHMRRDAGEAGLVVRQPAPAGLLAGNESGTGEEQAAGSSSGEDGHGKKAEREDARVALGSEGGARLWERRMSSLAASRGVRYFERDGTDGFRVFGRKGKREVHVVHHHHHSHELDPRADSQAAFPEEAGADEARATATAIATAPATATATGPRGRPVCVFAGLV